MISFDTFYIYYLSNLTNLCNLVIRVNTVKPNIYALQIVDMVIRKVYIPK